ncbi:MAG: ribose 5-phosphate isomerase B [Candidatus Caldatribacteriaceae bacterium]
MKVAIASDHAGFRLKEEIKKKLEERAFEVIDYGTENESPVGVGPFAQRVARSISLGEVERGILICGTGGGMSVCANRYPGVRAVLCFSEFTVLNARKHNDANVLVLGARTIEPSQALSLVDLFFQTPFDGGKYAERLRYLEEIEKEVWEILERKFSLRL